ncbi:MAG TPA: DNA polymerase/3'-5' exonuclease PolX [Thermoanaerobaculia bacterium]
MAAPVDRKEISRILHEVAGMLELAGANSFKVRAYENAARAILTYEGDLGEAVRSRELLHVPGIGETIFGNVESLLLTGELPLYDELRATFPPGLRDCLRVPRLGAKKVKALFESLGIDSLDALERACLDGRLTGIRGFGPKSAQHILKGIAFVRGAAGRFLYVTARARARAVAAALEATGLATRVEVAGSLRRRAEIVKDIDLVAASTRGSELAQWFRTLGDVQEIIGSGETKTSVRFFDGLAADLRVVSEEDFPAALLYFTGSKEHNTALRGRAKRMGLLLNEYGLFRDGGTERLPADSEAAIYEALGLAFIPPELRENAGEIEAAEKGELPRLVSDRDLQGVIHVHTTASDGRDSLEAMARGARDAGYRYVAFTDHSKTAAYAGGLSEERVLAQREEIRALRARMPELRIFHGTEADILADGSIDYGDAFLEHFDLVVASVHSRFGLSAAEQTARLVRAVTNPLVSILGHPTGRLLLGREGLAADLEAVFDAAASSGCALEINGSPHRLDLDWRLARSAIARGIPLSIDPDAHSVAGLGDAAYGVGVARKAWAEAGSILNARDADGFAGWLEKRRGGPIPESGAGVAP